MENETTEAPVAEETAPVNNLAGDLQQANIDSLAKDDPIMSGIPEPLKMSGVAGEMKPPIAAPINQIAPVSSNGEQTSAREAPKSDIPETDAAVPAVDSSPAGEIPSNEYDSHPSVTGEESNIPEEAEEEEIPFEEMDDMQKAQNLMFQIPGKMRLY